MFVSGTRGPILVVGKKGEHIPELNVSMVLPLLFFFFAGREPRFLFNLSTNDDGKS